MIVAILLRISDRSRRPAPYFPRHGLEIVQAVQEHGMSRQVRGLSLVFALLMVAVLVNITLIQVVNAGDYRDRPGNQRILLAEYDRERGPVLVDTDLIA